MCDHGRNFDAKHCADCVNTLGLMFQVQLMGVSAVEEGYVERQHLSGIWAIMDLDCDCLVSTGNLPASSPRFDAYTELEQCALDCVNMNAQAMTVRYVPVVLTRFDACDCMD